MSKTVRFYAGRFCDVFSQPTVGHKVIDVFGNDALLALDRLNQVILADARVFVDNDQVKEIRLVQAVFAAASVDFCSDLAVEDGTPFSMLDLIFCSF